MKMIRIICAGIFFVAAQPAFAQTFENGVGFQVFVLPGNVLETNQLSNYNGPITSSDKVLAIVPAISYGITFNFPVFEREGFAFGLQPGYLLNGMLRQDGFFLGTRGDAMISFRTGAHASYANYVEDERFFGIAAGVSAYSILNNGGVYIDKLFFIRPSMVLETGENHHKVKLFVQLWPYKSEYPSYTGGIPKITYWQFGITWEKWFDLGGG